MTVERATERRSNDRRRQKLEGKTLAPYAARENEREGKRREAAEWLGEDGGYDITIGRSQESNVALKLTSSSITGQAQRNPAHSVRNPAGSNSKGIPHSPKTSLSLHTLKATTSPH